MKLAQIILPQIGNDGTDLWRVHENFKHELLTRWGGFTAHEARGAWLDDRNTIQAEPVVVYLVAMELGAVLELRDMARRIASEAKQKCVMIVTPQGDVDFVKPENNSAQTS